MMLSVRIMLSAVGWRAVTMPQRWRWLSGGDVNGDRVDGETAHARNAIGRYLYSSRGNDGLSGLL